MDWKPPPFLTVLPLRLDPRLFDAALLCSDESLIIVGFVGVIREYGLEDHLSQQTTQTEYKEQKRANKKKDP